MLNKLAVLLFFFVVVAGFVWMVAHVMRGRRPTARARRGRRAGADTYSPGDSYSASAPFVHGHGGDSGTGAADSSSAGYSAAGYGSTHNQDASGGSWDLGGGGDFGGGGAGGDFGGGDSGGGDSGGGSD